MDKNTPELWDKVWKISSSIKKDIYTLEKEEHSIRWQRMERLILKKYGSFKDLDVIELGAGAGTYAALIAKRGARVTILDYSNNALARSKYFFARNGVSAEYIQQNALSLSADVVGRYNVSMSFGLTEHFKGPDRIKINKAHFDVLRKGGITFISVPNAYNLPYRIFKFIAECVGKWNYGEEYPYTRNELRHLCRTIGVAENLIFGDSFFSSLNFVNPISVAQRVFKWENRLATSSIKKEKGTVFDQYLSYALILYAEK